MVKSKKPKVEEKVVEEVKEEVKQSIQGKVATKDINATYRKGSFVPQDKLDQWKSVGLEMDVYFE